MLQSGNDLSFICPGYFQFQNLSALESFDKSLTDHNKKMTVYKDDRHCRHQTKRTEKDAKKNT